MGSPVHREKSRHPGGSDIPVKADSNDITLTVRLTDRAGNTTTEKVTFSIDRTAPVDRRWTTTTIL